MGLMMTTDQASATEMECDQALTEMEQVVPVKMQCESICVPFDDCGGWIDSNEKIIHVVIVPIEGTYLFNRYVIAHEYGHWFDVTHLTPSDKAIITGIMGWDAWQVESYADVVAQCLGYANRHEGGVYRYPDSPQASESACDALKAGPYLPALGAQETAAQVPLMALTPVGLRTYPTGPTHKLLGHWAW